MKVLILEDDIATVEILKIILGEAGYEIETYADGRDLLTNNYERPDIYLLDVYVNGINGLEICKHLKSLPQTKNIPIIILSVVNNLEKLALEACADAYIEKPFDIEIFVEKIAFYVGKASKIKQRINP